MNFLSTIGSGISSVGEFFKSSAQDIQKTLGLPVGPAASFPERMLSGIPTAPLRAIGSGLETLGGLFPSPEPEPGVYPSGTPGTVSTMRKGGEVVGLPPTAEQMENVQRGGVTGLSYTPAENMTLASASDLGIRSPITPPPPGPMTPAGVDIPPPGPMTYAEPQPSGGGRPSGVYNAPATPQPGVSGITGASTGIPGVSPISSLGPNAGFGGGGSLITGSSTGIPGTSGGSARTGLLGGVGTNLGVPFSPQGLAASEEEKKKREEGIIDTTGETTPFRFQAPAAAPSDAVEATRTSPKFPADLEQQIVGATSTIQAEGRVDLQNTESIVKGISRMISKGDLSSKQKGTLSNLLGGLTENLTVQLKSLQNIPPEPIFDVSYFTSDQTTQEKINSRTEEYENMQRQLGIPNNITQLNDTMTRLAAVQEAQYKVIDEIDKNPDLPAGLAQRRIQEANEQFGKQVLMLQNQADILTQRLNLAKNQLKTKWGIVEDVRDEEKRQKTQNLQRFTTLLNAGALSGASESDVTQIAQATGLSSDMVNSAIQAKQGDESVSIVTKTDQEGNLIGINRDTGEIVWSQGGFGGTGIIAEAGQLFGQELSDLYNQQDWAIDEFILKAKNKGSSDENIIGFLDKVTELSRSQVKSQVEQSKGTSELSNYADAFVRSNYDKGLFSSREGELKNAKEKAIEQIENIPDGAESEDGIVFTAELKQQITDAIKSIPESRDEAERILQLELEE